MTTKIAASPTAMQVPETHVTLTTRTSTKSKLVNRDDDYGDGHLYLSAARIRFPFLAAALLQSAVAGAMSLISANFLNMALQPLPSIGNPLDLSPPRKESSDTVVCELEIGAEPLALVKRPKLTDTTTTASTATTTIHQPFLRFPYTLGNSLETVAMSHCEALQDDGDLPLDYSMPTEHVCKHPGCNKVFRYNHALVNHYRVHTGERPFVCDFPGCQQAFARQSNLLTHRMIHLDREMRRTFACPVPGCQKNFLKKTNLDDHMNLHLNKRPYGCEFPGCGKSFRCRSNLSGHKRVHSREAAGGSEPVREATTNPPATVNHLTPLERKIDSILAKARASVAVRIDRSSPVKRDPL